MSVLRIASLLCTIVAITLACNPNNSESYRNCDWRSVIGAVTPVRNQGRCAACWAFAAVAVVETYQFRISREELALSEQHVVDCAHKYNPQLLGRCFERTGPVCGGDPFEALKAIRSEMGGIYTNETYPWRSDQNAAQERARGRCAKHPGEPKYPGSLSMPAKASFRHDINDGIKKLIVEKGPVVASIHFPKDWENPNQPHIYTKPCIGVPDHAVAVVGFGEEQGQSFWILKNSHGSDWADGGYIRLAMRPDYDDGDCGLKRRICYLN